MPLRILAKVIVLHTRLGHHLAGTKCSHCRLLQSRVDLHVILLCQHVFSKLSARTSLTISTNFVLNLRALEEQESKGKSNIA